MSELDLDIDNYTIKDLETFFKINPNKKYTASEIELKEYKLRQVLLESGHIDKRYKSDLIEFLTRAKKILIAAKCKEEQVKNKPTTIPKNYRLDDIDYPSIKEKQDVYHREQELVTRKDTQFINTFNSEYFPGNVNPLSTRVITKCLAIDTKFRDNIYSTQSSDFIIQLPTKLNKVVSMQLASIEFPVSFYGISAKYGNNYFYLNASHYVCDCSQVDISAGTPFVEASKIVVVPDGNYNATDLVSVINNSLSPKDQYGNIIDPSGVFAYIQLSLDVTDTGSGTGKVTIGATGNLAYTVRSLNLDFTRDICGNIVDNVDLTTKLGWSLGFTRRKYTGHTSYTGETVIEPAALRYIYLAVDDYNNNVNNHFVTAFNKSIMSNNILARISLKGTYFSLIMNSDMNIVTEPRKYFGPVDIQRLHIQLLDDHGRVLDMNSGNFSFCLNFKMLYDL